MTELSVDAYAEPVLASSWDVLLAWTIRFFQWAHDRLRRDMENDEWERTSVTDRRTER
jgi:hypothetical protein